MKHYRCGFFFCILSLGLFHTAGNAVRPSPRVIMLDEFPVVELSPELVQLIKTKFPNLRIPTRKDMTGEWATFRRKQEVPYACWGDFNGDGLADVALILLGNSYWRAIVFHQLSDGRYVPFQLDDFPGGDDYTQVHPAQNFHIFTLKAGQPVTIAGKPMRVTTTRYDTLGFFLLRDPSSGIHYHWFPASDSLDRSQRFYGMYGVIAFGRLTD